MTKTNLHQKLLEKIEAGLKANGLPSYPKTLYEPYSYAISVGGKRIRPVLTLLACGLCEGNVDEALPAALATEILHNFTLVHDDIMDSAETRRGKPSVFRRWNKNIAILSGDAMFADAYKKLNFYGQSKHFSKEEFASIHAVFTDAVITVCEGQALDMEFVDRKEVSHNEYLQMISGKTAALLSCSLELGAITAHATPKKRQQLHNIGHEMGIAFQIQDDLLDATADPEKFGKRPGGDIFEGKKTYLTILALERADAKQKKLIESTLDTENPDPDHVDEVLAVMKALNVLHDISEEVNQHYQNALNLLTKFNPSDYQKELEKLLIFLRNRDH